MSNMGKDSKLLDLALRWHEQREALEAVDEICEETASAAVACYKIHQAIAATPATTADGVAVKLGVIARTVFYESHARECPAPPHWVNLLVSAIADLDRAAGARLKPPPQLSVVTELSQSRHSTKSEVASP